MKRLQGLCILLCLAVLAACVPGLAPTPTLIPTPGPVAISPIEGMPTGTDGFPWWNDTVFYEIFVRSFYDSNGDGIGDINGLIQKLDYLNDGDPNTTDDLGITGIWLMPICQSPSYHGYDVMDYYTVEEDYGTNEDFLRLMEEAHKRGIRVIVDMVFNHTSNQHPWFISSLDPDSEYRDWYIWVDEAPKWGGPWGQKVWHRADKGYYYGLFWSGMPDLNYENPEVSEQMLDVARFWLEEMGVDGFRLDAVKFLIEEGRKLEHTEATLAWLRRFREFYRQVKPEALTVGEVWDPVGKVAPYIETGAFDLAFEFDTAKAIIESVNSGSRHSIALAHALAAKSYSLGQFAPFITNHDQNRGMSQLGNDWAKARLAAFLLLTSPGVPFIYYGEEIGMTGRKPDERLRTPMQWSPEENAGFTTGRPWERVNPDFREKNVQTLSQDPDSLLNFYRKLISLRNSHEALRVGDYLKVKADAKGLYAFLRHSDDADILVIVNLSDEEVEDYRLDMKEGPFEGEVAAVELLHGAEVAPPAINEAGGFDDYRPLPTLPARTGYIIQLVRL